MKKLFVILALGVLVLWGGLCFADDQTDAKQAACESSLDITTLPPFTPILKANLPDLAGYYSCKAAMKDDVQLCSVFPDGSALKSNCQDAYNNYYATFGKLYKNGQMSDEFLGICSKAFKSKSACDQLGEVLLSGKADDCDHIEGATEDNIKICKDMVSDDPSGGKAYFMMVLRKGDPAACDHIDNLSVAAVCRGLLNKSTDACEADAGAGSFKKIYCQYLSTEGSVNGTKKEN